MWVVVIIFGADGNREDWDVYGNAPRPITAAHKADVFDDKQVILI